MRIAQCHDETCHIFCNVATMWLKDGHLYCTKHKPEDAESYAMFLEEDD